MLKETPQYALRRKWVKDLRENSDAQCTNILCHEFDGHIRYCALGLLYYKTMGRNSDRRADVGCYRELREAAGLNSNQSRAIITMNDDGKTFGEIADYIETLE